MAGLDIPKNWQKNVALAPMTTIGLGGAARYYCEVYSESELAQHILCAKSLGIPVFILAGGSNTLFADSGFSGLVMKLRLHEIVDRATGVVQVGAGYDWDAFVQWSIQRGYVGIEALSGIPGSVGGTPIQNVGAYGQEVAEVVSAVRVLDTETGDFRELRADECDFSYRASRFKFRDRGRFIVTAVEFSFVDRAVRIAYDELAQRVKLAAPGFSQLDVQAQLAVIREQVIHLRRCKSMLVDPADPNSRSLGSFFTNPIVSQSEYEAFCLKARSAGFSNWPAFTTAQKVKLSAAWLVERAGFEKGHRYKGVGVSKNHSLALINVCGTTQEVIELQNQITTRVRDVFGIDLHREPVLAARES